MTDITNISQEETNLEKFSPKKAELIQLKEKFSGLKIQSIDDKESYKKVTEARQTCRNQRIQIEKGCKAIRENAVAFQKKVIAFEKELIEVISPTEDELKAEIDRIDAEKERIKKEKERQEAEKLSKRIEALAQYRATFPTELLKSMPDTDFDELLKEKYEIFEKEEEEKRIAEKKRLEEERKIKEEQDRIRKEQEELEAKRRKLEEDQRKFEEEKEKQRLEELRKEEEKKKEPITSIHSLEEQIKKETSSEVEIQKEIVGGDIPTDDIVDNTICNVILEPTTVQESAQKIINGELSKISMDGTPEENARKILSLQFGVTEENEGNGKEFFVTIKRETGEIFLYKKLATQKFTIN